MDQALEMAIVMSIFIIAFSIVIFTTSVLCSYYINTQFHSIKDSIASIIASIILIQNGISYNSWESWTPLINYSLSGNTYHINVTCFSIKNGELLLLWNKTNGIEINDDMGSSYRFIILDNGNAIKLEVRVR
ncbi:MAG: hypothetical protein DSO09_02870 [Candidatus Methanomethylicota archaeon]|jgi:hypothetical protein|uniref:Uncharacterized protein n=1 Tax=Thermoproteota archaeon TaxID=2056631 RepID=A0A523BDN0_9CREN|nr:MAG: hypothetical protein EF809_04135 [Candidatus Verstraetearchaeota archaeon]TDA38984.1 MAG: hypothetical protein DSO09_02870 [Candidatus Verstraetearchaeota archaeon]